MFSIFSKEPTVKDLYEISQKLDKKLTELDQKVDRVAKYIDLKNSVSFNLLLCGIPAMTVIPILSVIGKAACGTAYHATLYHGAIIAIAFSVIFCVIAILKSLRSEYEAKQLSPWKEVK